MSEEQLLVHLSVLKKHENLLLLIHYLTTHTYFFLITVQPLLNSHLLYLKFLAIQVNWLLR